MKQMIHPEIVCSTCPHLKHNCAGPSGKGSHDRCFYYEKRSRRFTNTEAPLTRPRWCPRIYDDD